LKVSAVAHPIQGLIKYHGLKNPVQRVPYHDSISVCIQALTTTTTVESSGELKIDEIVVNGKESEGKDRQRVETVLDRLKKLGKFSGGFKVASENSLKEGKGLGFSASGFAALGLAASKTLDLRLDEASLSEIVRLGAGSATRSLAGGFAVWYVDKNGKSYAEQLRAPEDIDLSMVVVPICSEVKTDEAHAEVLSSPLFRARLKNVQSLLEKMKLAIRRGDVATLGRLAEEDTLNLHAITMTGKSHMVLWEPDTIRIIKEVIRLREEGVPAWYSIDTGPSVFINTLLRDSNVVLSRLNEIGFRNAFASNVGGKPFLSGPHLF
jgi:phosphomevalonate decarboxylase